MVGNGRYGGFHVLVLEDSVLLVLEERNTADNSKKQVKK
jgi:hypothetical protein